MIGMASRKMSKKEKEEFEYNEALKKLDVIDYENKVNDLKKRKLGQNLKKM